VVQHSFQMMMNGFVLHVWLKRRKIICWKDDERKRINQKGKI
jgi:hypothetical protein